MLSLCNNSSENKGTPAGKAEGPCSSDMGPRILRVDWKYLGIPLVSMGPGFLILMMLGANHWSLLPPKVRVIATVRTMKPDFGVFIKS